MVVTTHQIFGESVRFGGVERLAYCISHKETKDTKLTKLYYTSVYLCRSFTLW